MLDKTLDETPGVKTLDKTINIEKIQNGIVIDHIKAGQGTRVFNWLQLGKSPYSVAFVLNASSRGMGRKDIIKIANTQENKIAVNFDILGLIDPNISVNIIEAGAIAKKFRLKLPEKVEDVIICKNPRCITSTEKYIPHIFYLENAHAQLYRCEYCDELRNAEDLS
jgi:aspartate carbamoyltransferase regulatory subunit